MSDLKRWTSDDATEMEAKLLEAARGGGPSPEVRARIAAAIHAMPLGGPGGDPASVASAGAAKGAAAAMTKWAAVAVLGGIGTVAAWHFARSPAPTTADQIGEPADAGMEASSAPGLMGSSSSPLKPPSPLLTAAHELPTARPETNSSAEPIAPTDSHTRRSPAPKTRPEGESQAQVREENSGALRSNERSSLDSELHLLEESKSELDARHLPKVFSLLKEYERRHPQGVLSIEAQLLRIDALVAANRTREAKQAAMALVRSHPNMTETPRIMMLIESLADGNTQEKKP